MDVLLPGRGVAYIRGFKLTKVTAILQFFYALRRIAGREYVSTIGRPPGYPDRFVIIRLSTTITGEVGVLSSLVG
jgi:hypothetical protein